MKFSATFEEKVKKAEEQGDRPLVSSYLNPSKVDPKEPVSFALLEEDPLIFWKIYGESVPVSYTHLTLPTIYSV